MSHCYKLLYVYYRLIFRVADQKLVPNIRGIVVIDVVEGSAMDALSAMQVIDCYSQICCWVLKYLN